MELRQTINVPVTFHDAFEIYRQIICPESIISRSFGFRAYFLHIESDNIIIETNLPYDKNNYLVCNEDGLRLLSLPDVVPESMLTRHLLWANNLFSKFKMNYKSRGIHSSAESIEKILNEEVDFLDMAQHRVIKMPFKDRRVTLERNDGVYSALLRGKSLKEVAEMEIRLFNIIFQSICEISE